jgi:hypothetical protein
VTDAGHRQAAIGAAALVLHDDECGDGETTATCPRWRSGSDPQSRFHAHHAGHVEYYRDRARAVLDAAAPHLEAGVLAERAVPPDQSVWLLTAPNPTETRSVTAVFATEAAAAEWAAGNHIEGAASEPWRIHRQDDPSDPLAAKLTALGVPRDQQAMYANAIQQDPDWRERLPAVTTRAQLDHYTETGAIAP